MTFSIHTRSENCVSLRGLTKYFTSYWSQGVSRVVDPYGPYRWNMTFSIRTRSENCISLRGLTKYFTSYWSQGVSRVVDPYGPYRWNRMFSIRTRSENCISLRGLRKCISLLTGVKGSHWLSIRTVRTDGI